MAKLICKNCKLVFDDSNGDACPKCRMKTPHIYDFQNSDTFLKNEVPRVMEERQKMGLEGLVGDLECVLINTEESNHQAAVDELLLYTGLDFDTAFEDNVTRTCVLKTGGSADFLIQSRKGVNNPFTFFNVFPKSKHLPNTRLETFVFQVADIEEYVRIQQSRKMTFSSPGILKADHYSYIQTLPMKATGTSVGFIQWTGTRGKYGSQNSKRLDWKFIKPDSPHLQNIKGLDHTALRVRAEDRDAAIIEFMRLTNHHFDFAIYINAFNSITNIARLSDNAFAMVFTSGISPYLNDDDFNGFFTKSNVTMLTGATGSQ
jgi:hypothetical protein